MNSPYASAEGQSQTNSNQSQTPGPSTPAPGGARSKSMTGKKGRKSRGASITPSVASDLQGSSAGGFAQSTTQWAAPGVLDSQSRTEETADAAVEGSAVARAGSVIQSGVPGAADDDGEGEEDLFPDMADDDYSAQLSWQSQSKDNLKVLMDNFSAEQYDRYEAYRRNALPKQAVRRVIQQTLGQQVSTPVAQVVAGFAKVFVGEVIERARKVQQSRGESGPLSPDHLREAYRMYQEEAGRVGAARPMRGKRHFTR